MEVEAEARIVAQAELGLPAALLAAEEVEAVAEPIPAVLAE